MRPPLCMCLAMSLATKSVLALPLNSSQHVLNSHVREEYSDAASTVVTVDVVPIEAVATGHKSSEHRQRKHGLVALTDTLADVELSGVQDLAFMASYEAWLANTPCSDTLTSCTPAKPPSKT
ncbi:hypothetical protein BKA62DRAFT_682032 [Auriculariales sp. MPI-PUGE-AT-0066]|nr:hypothetical protein BKA62DRAFT_682032 [Auriculariales sp. MPI-PUGE-AT-0066]